MQRLVLEFDDPAQAATMVAGVPAAARAVRVAQRQVAGERTLRSCALVAPGGWGGDPWYRSEIERLAPGVAIRFGDSQRLPDSRGRAAADRRVAALPLLLASAGLEQRAFTSDEAALRAIGNAIVAATTKAGDGFVSRHFNRPVSQAISRVALRWHWVRPLHATFGTALLGLMMALSLFFGGDAGLVAGAVLFQAASVFDGVDGEIARATYRTSTRGAMLDSLTDAATNLAFFAGLSFNLWTGSDPATGAAGLAGFLALGAGLIVIGLKARATREPFTFDVLKVHVRGGGSRILHVLMYLTMRDFFAALAALLVIVGQASLVMATFTIAACLWLFFAIYVLFLRRATMAPGQRIPS